jgi:hypothetical protein
MRSYNTDDTVRIATIFGLMLSCDAACQEDVIARLPKHGAIENGATLQRQLSKCQKSDIVDL